MWHRFGQGLRKIILSAVAQAERGTDLSTQALLRALIAERELPAARLLEALGLTAAVCDALVQENATENAVSGEVLTLTREARQAVDRAYALAAELGDEYIGGEHLLLAFVQEPDGSAAGRALAQAGVSWQPLWQALVTQQKWRVRSPQGAVPPPRARRVIVRLRRSTGRALRLAAGITLYNKPFMSYVVFRKRTTSDPYPFYTRLRRSPVYWDSLMNQWVVTGYKEVVAALAEPRFSQRICSAEAWAHENLPPLAAREFRRLQGGIDRQMLFQDAPDQPQQRMRVAKRFTPRVIALMHDQTRQVMEEMLDAAQEAGQMEAGQMEVIADLAIPFPLRAIARMMDLPIEDLARFKTWSHDYFRYLTFETSLKEELAAYGSITEAAAYFRALLPARRKRATGTPDDDLITLLVQPDDDGGFLSEDDVVANCLLLLATGHENTTRLIGCGLLALLRRPDQWRALCSDPALAGTAVEEMLRFDSPVQWTLRYVNADLEWQGFTIRKGQRVQIGIAAANRDPAQFPEADEFQATRTPNRHLAFGHGPHFCLGAALARMETQIFFRSMSCRFPDLHLRQTPQWCQEGLAFRGLTSLHVGWRTDKKEGVPA